MLFGASDSLMAVALTIRFEVFVAEQHVPLDIEIDKYDRNGSNTVHAIVYDGNQAIAAGRFYEKDSDTVQIGRMAVRKDVRGKGTGRVLLDALITEARKRGYHQANLHAQMHAQGFYEKAGFTAIGEEFDDAGIPHIEMQRSIK